MSSFRTCSRIKQRLNVVLFKQISAFVLHGVLMDPANEFFLRLSKASISEKEVCGRHIVFLFITISDAAG